jgi:hypothetical protein
MKYSAILASTLVAVASAKDWEISVGKGGTKFTPNEVSGAKAGDRIVFTFESGPHDVVSSSLDKPCAPDSSSSPAFASKVFSSGDKNKFVVDVKDEKPIWFYCSVASHCKSGGMYGVVNPPSGKSVKDYDAASVSAAVTPSKTTGEFVDTVPAASGSSSSASGTASGSSSSGSMATGTMTGTAASATSSSAAGKVEYSFFALAAGIVAALL